MDWSSYPIYHLLPAAFCLLLSAFCFLPTAFCFLPSAFCLLLSAFCLLLSAYCPPTIRFHSNTALWEDAAKYSLSGEKLTVSKGSLLSSMVCCNLPSSTDHTRAVLSSPAETSHLPSGENSAQWTGPWCPVSVFSSFHPGAEKIRILPSSQAVATLLLSREKEMSSRSPRVHASCQQTGAAWLRRLRDLG